MNLFPPQTEIELYKDGFGDADLLGRRPSGQNLSDLLERIEDPIVVALDGPWGSGKTYFLRRWVGAHVHENGGTATTVYFDAFRNDYLDDPLIGLTGAIGDRLETPRDQGNWEKAKSMAFRLALPAFRIGAAVATSGISEVSGAVVAAGVSAGTQELDKAAEAFWRREDGRKAAMQHFREALTALTEPQTNNPEEPRRLVVVIDELDRCRPDYALAVLEVVKHFFSVPRVHFVLGVNLEALAQIVKARYGAGLDAITYLQRFISVSMHLPESVPGPQEALVPVKYFESAGSKMDLESPLMKVAKKQLELVTSAGRISLRDVEKLLSRLVLLPNRAKIGRYLWGWQELIVSLALMQAVKPELFKVAIDGRLDASQIRDFFGITPEMVDQDARGSATYNHSAYIIDGLWQYVLSEGQEPQEERELFARGLDRFGMSGSPRILANLKSDFFSTFGILSSDD